METSFLMICFKFCTLDVWEEKQVRNVSHQVSLNSYTIPKHVTSTGFHSRNPYHLLKEKLPPRKAQLMWVGFPKGKGWLVHPVAAEQSWVSGHLHPAAFPGIRATVLQHQQLSAQGWDPGTYPQIKHSGTGECMAVSRHHPLKCQSLNQSTLHQDQVRVLLRWAYCHL